MEKNSTQKLVQIGYMDSLTDKTMKPLTEEAFKTLISSESVRQTIASIEAEPDAEKKSELKRKLPVVLFACQMTENGERPTAQNKLAVASGFCMHDWDHMPCKPQQFYMENIAGREDELGIVLVHVTPRGEGLRLITVMKGNEDVSAHQQQLAAEFGMEKFADAKIKDLTRLSFLPSDSYILYLNENGLFNHHIVVTPLPEEAFTPPASSAEGAKEGADTDIVVTPQQAPPLAECMNYENLKFSSIIQLLETRIASEGKINVGQRNDVLYAMSKELRHICSYNFHSLYLLLSPYFSTLPDAEIRKTISSALGSTGSVITSLLKGVLNELQQTNLIGEEEEAKQPKLPKLSQVEEMILTHYPSHLRSQVFLASLPIWGVYGTHIRFDYLDGKTNSLSFMTAVVGKSGSGKAYAAHLFDQMTKHLQLQDALERTKADEYLKEWNKSGESGTKPDDPRPKVRIYGDDITTSQLLEYLDNLEGEHGLQFTEEVVRLNKAKRTVYGDNDDLYCKSFDNSIGGKESKSKLTRNIRIPIYLNTLFCGTPNAMHGFYNNPEGGLNNRVIFTFMPNVSLKSIPRYTKFSKEDQALFDEVINRLMNAGKDGKLVELPWLEKAINGILKKWSEDDIENPNEVWRDLGKRALVIAMRVGVLQWFLRGCPAEDDKNEIRAILKVVRWTADVVRKNIYEFCGKEYEQLNNADNSIRERCKYNSKTKKLFSVLNQEFSTSEVITLRIQNGDSGNCVGSIISRWKSEGLIEKIGNNRFKKIVEQAV